MSASTQLVADPPGAANEVATQRPARVVLALARTESRRLLRHPVFLGGVGLSVLFLATQTDTNTGSGVGQAYFNLMGWGVMPLALAAMLAINLAVTRKGRDRTGELNASLPMPEHARTTAWLLLTICGTAIGAGLTGAAYRYLGASDGLVVDYNGRTAIPSWYELAQGPLVVLVLGVLGVTLALWLPRLVVAFAVAFALLASEMLLVLFTLSQSQLRWLLPFASSATFTRPNASFPAGIRADDGLAGFDVATAGWHLLYLGALTILLATSALLKPTPLSRRRLLAAGGAALVVVAAAVFELVSANT